MKLKNSIVVLVCLVGMGSLQAHTIDPIEDFRYPESLFEVVHEGIVHVMYMIKNHGTDQHTLQQAYESLRNMHDQFDVVMRYHPTQIKEEDCDFLLSMIDRLESTIDSCSGNQHACSEIKDECEAMRSKVMQQKA